MQVITDPCNYAPPTQAGLFADPGNCVPPARGEREDCHAYSTELESLRDNWGIYRATIPPGYLTFARRSAEQRQFIANKQCSLFDKSYEQYSHS